MTDDAMTVFQPVGKDAPLSVGDITSTGYRTLFVRVNAPTNAQEQNISLQLVATYQDPQTAITKWITGIRGNGVIPTTGEPLQISTGSIGSELVYKDGYALIDNNEIYYGSSGTYDIETTGSGAYKIYLDEAGSFGETTGTLASNQLALAEITVSSGTCTTGSVVDKRVFLPGIQAGTTGARPTTPNKTGDMYFDITNAALYGAKTSTAWTLITSTGGGSTATTFIELTDTPANYSSAASYLLRVNSSTNAVEFVSATGLALDGFGTPSTGNDLNASTSRHGLLPKLTGSTTDYLLANGTWAAIPGSSGGEANTASNENTTGVGVFWQKDGVNLEFKGVHSTGGVITVTDTTGTHTINLDFVSTGVKLDDLGTPDDNTNLNASTSAHGLLPKLGGSTTTYLAGDGTWGTPPNTGSTTFVALDDTPASYTTGTAGQLLRVNSSTNAIEFVSSTGIKLDDLGTPDDNTDLNASTSYHGLLPKLTGSTTNYLLADGTWAAIPGSSGGEANTGSNENTTGVGVFWQKDGVNLEFKGIHSTGNISVTDATGTHTVNIDVITTGITLNDLDTPYAVTTGNVMSFGAHSAGFTEQSSTATTGTATINWSLGNKALYTRSTGSNGACTIAFTDPPKSMSVMLIIRGSTAGSSGAISWSTGNTIYWSSTATPSFSTGVSAIDVVGLYYSTGLGGYLAMGTTNFSTV
jgi:hypothetical protein